MALGGLTVVQDCSVWTPAYSFHPAFHVGNGSNLEDAIFLNSTARTVERYQKWLGPNLSGFAAEKRASAINEAPR